MTMTMTMTIDGHDAAQQCTMQISSARSSSATHGAPQQSAKHTTTTTTISTTTNGFSAVKCGNGSNSSSSSSGNLWRTPSMHAVAVVSASSIINCRSAAHSAAQQHTPHLCRAQLGRARSSSAGHDHVAQQSAKQLDISRSFVLSLTMTMTMGATRLSRARCKSVEHEAGR